MKKSILVLTALAGLMLASCQSFKKGEGGLEYKFFEDKGGEKAVGGDVLAMDIVVKTDRDSLLASTYDLGLPQIAPVIPDSLVQGGYPGDNNTILKMLGEGDSATFKLNLDTMAARTGQPKPDFADKYIQFTIKVKKLFKKGSLTDVESNKLQPKKTATGLQYVIKEEGSGANPVVGDTVVLNYTGKLTNEKLFDTNDPELAKKEGKFNPMRPYEPLRVRIGHTPVIPGWTEGLQLLKKGGKATLIIPSSLGYGERQQSNEIPPYAPLVFDVEVLDIIAGPKGDTPQVVAPTGTPVTPPAN
jgi:FKBP-type peptidyl-prolyl cis-trans isomerase